MLNTNISFQDAQENGYAISENTKTDSVTIYSPFDRKLVTITGLDGGIVKVQLARGDLLYASKVDISFFSVDTFEKKMMRIDMEIPEQKCKRCTCMITEDNEHIDVSPHWN